MEDRIDEILRSNNAMRFCFKFIMLWISSCDGKIDESESNLLDNIFKDCEFDKVEISKLVNKKDDLVFCKVINYLKINTNPQGKNALIEMAIMFAIADGRLAISENYILRFLSDVLGIRKSDFENFYSELSGSKFPAAGDPSSKAWWDKKVGNGSFNGNENQNSRKQTSARGGLSYAEALVIFGLHKDCSDDEIKKRYKELIKSHHPDRYVPLGDDAVRVATAMSAKINQAYGVLMP